MKAARLYKEGSPLLVEQVAEPTTRAGGAIVRVLSSHIPNFTQQVISGELGYALPKPFPFTPGNSAIGVVESVADDVFGIQVGQTVFCDPYIFSPKISGAANGILIGWTGLAADSYQMQSVWKDSSWAEKVLWPAECLTPVPEMPSIDPTQLATIGYLAVTYGGFLQGNLRPSQVLIVNGATGGLGVAAVLLALAMGVSKIVAVGRDKQTLEKLVQLDPKRVISAPLTGNAAEDSDRLNQLAGGADIVLDVLGGVTNPSPTLACINALRPGGTAVFVGGVKADIPLPYAQIMLQEITIRGAFMYPKYAPRELLRMAASGTLNLHAIQTQVFSLSQINEAIAKAATLKGLDYCILAPNLENP